MQDKQSQDLRERIAFYELRSIKEDSDTFDDVTNAGLKRNFMPKTDDKEDFIYGFTNEKIKETLQWLIKSGYLKGSAIDITSTPIIIHYGNQSPMTEKGIEYYKKLSKKYDKKYFAELARKQLSKTKIGEGYESE